MSGLGLQHAAETAVRTRILYVSYDGLTDPLGRSQVLPYLEGLSARGYDITVLSCEKPERLARDASRIQRICDRVGLGWRPLRYHKRPPVLSTLYDLALLKRVAARLHRAKLFDVIHCRSYIPALVGLELKRRFGAAFLFDMRGFWPDERVEGNIWPQSNPLFRLIYTHVKKLEAELLAGADHIVSLTEEGRRELQARPILKASTTAISVIPCCADFDHFALVSPNERAGARNRLGIPNNAKVVAYLGSIGTWYMLEEMLDFFAIYQRRHTGALFLFITHDDASTIRTTAATRGIAEERLVICAASREEVPELMAAADLGLFFIKPVFSKKASSPTKMGEILALGLPVVTNAGVGDVADILASTAGGALIHGFSARDYELAVETLERQVTSPEQIRERARPWFDIVTGVERYDAVYRTLANGVDRAT